MGNIIEIELEQPVYTEYQNQILNSQKRFTITEAATKVGKTFSHICWLFIKAHEGEPGYEYWWIAPIYTQSEIAFKRLVRYIAESGEYTINLSKLSITTPVGTIITFKSADNPNTLYGENVHAFVFDEYSRAKEEAWFALRTTITYTKAKGKFIGNVVAKNWAWDLARKAERGEDPDYEYFKINAYQAAEAGILSLAEIEQAKKDLPEHMFRMLYLAEFQELEGLIFPESELKRYREFPVDMEYFTIAFADTADQGLDNFAMPIARVYGNRVYVFDAIFDQANLTVQEGQVQNKVKECHITNLVVETNAFGAYFSRRIRELIPELEVFGIIAKQRKMMRVLANSGLVKNYFYFPENMNNDLKRFMEQVCSILKTATKEDDAPDALTGLAAYLEKYHGLFKE